jgi:hypothetical protein
VVVRVPDGPAFLAVLEAEVAQAGRLFPADRALGRGQDEQAGEGQNTDQVLPRTEAFPG